MSVALERPGRQAGCRLPGLLQTLRSRAARIGVVGLGYLGLPQVLRCTACSSRVLGFDIDRR